MKNSKNNWQLLSSKDQLGIKIIMICIIVLLFLLGVFFFLKSNVSSYDKVSLCPERVQRHTVLLVDKSDTPTLTQSIQIEAIISKLKNNLQPLEKLTITSLSESYGDINILFSKCNPGTGEQANTLYQNPTIIQKKFDEKFGIKFKDIENLIKHHGEAQQSHILEALQSISVLPDFSNEVEKKRLIIISDMMQHSDWLSHYNTIPSYNDFVQTLEGRSLQADMKNINLEIYYIVRRPTKPSVQNQHILFWKDYFQKQQVSSIKFRKIN